LGAIEERKEKGTKEYVGQGFSLANNKQKIAKDKNAPYSPFSKGGDRGIYWNRDFPKTYNFSYDRDKQKIIVCSP